MITLASDFGTPYPAAMKGVLCQRTDARLIDVSHEFPRQDIRAAAFWLRETLPYFPPATHLIVVDPGVGTDRNALVLRAGEHTLVGPDNGVLRPVARQLTDGGQLEASVIDESRLERVEPTVDSARTQVAASARDDARPASNTFHGRDVFAPAAAAVHDTPLEALEDCAFLESVATEMLVDCELPTATLEEDGARATGEVLVVDDFGNVITNVPGDVLRDHERVVANGEAVPVGETFAAVSPGERLATVGSHGYVELDVNQGRGDEAFELEVGDRVILETAVSP
ncbi:SAM-dependent chlorinase/fluorinase [Natronolimnobius sp. AArcel1]|uniref:SAM hydrolase/SAM-dependent halogenase family protein n=1 Tax=Natronolimnobius sp. AArcel1 TaxID=1679093 RepID=UPI0013EB704D|nr:SAM-dependent chlorinase/fluorinase [Natronolimnobius sp. AArcel1]NGM69692.1 SAM-dependent chlorinase/fluorinase [Natronolimnobius sp. AArcel1]